MFKRKGNVGLMFKRSSSLLLLFGSDNSLGGAVLFAAEAGSILHPPPPPTVARTLPASPEMAPDTTGHCQIPREREPQAC